LLVLGGGDPDPEELTGRGARYRMLELQARQRSLEAEGAAAERRATERERALPARELHDILSHSVTTMMVDAEAGAVTRDDIIRAVPLGAVPLKHASPLPVIWSS
jgi:signal transduction histidine kinase